MATTAQIIDQVIRRLSELSVTTPVHWTRSELLDYLTEALNELNLISGELQRTESLQTVLGVNAYNIAFDAIAPLAIRVNGYYLLKEPVIELDNEVDWEMPDQVRKDIKVWCPLGIRSFIIWPRPIVQPTQVDVEELYQHPTITDGAVDLLIRPEYESALEDYMIHRAMFREGGAEVDQMEPFYARFLDMVQQLSSRNIIRRYPAWDTSPETKTSESTFNIEVDSGTKR